MTEIYAPHHEKFSVLRRFRVVPTGFPSNEVQAGMQRFDHLSFSRFGNAIGRDKLTLLGKRIFHRSLVLCSAERPYQSFFQGVSREFVFFVHYLPNPSLDEFN